MGRVAGSIPALEILDLQQADPLLAGLEREFAEQDAGIGQQVVEDDPGGLAAVGGGEAALVALGAGARE